MLYTKQKAFTLVELIVVVTILAILATIGFVSYSSYLTGVRDTNRLAQMVSISDGLELYRTQKDLPLPDASVEVSVNGSLIAYQGTAGANTLETIDFTKGGVDPRDGTYFSYYLTKDRKHYQLLGFLEEEASITSQISPHPNPLLGRRGDNKNSPSSSEGEGVGGGGLFIAQTQAVSYDTRIPTVYGRKLGILTDDLNTPIEQTGADVDITSGTTGLIAHMTDTETLSGSSLQSINPKASCLRIKQLAGGSSDGVYEINPTGVADAEFDAYCDMTTNGGGWTYLVTIDTDEGLLYSNDLWWNDNYTGAELITNIGERGEQGVYSSFYSVAVNELSFYTNDGGFSSYELNEGYTGKDVQSLISQAASSNGASQTSGGVSSHTRIVIGNQTDLQKGSNDYNCAITYGAGNILHILTSNSSYIEHTSIFNVAPTSTISPRGSFFGGGSAIGLGYNRTEIGNTHVSQTCIEDGDMWDDNTYVVLMGR